jgi:hypothetical protein
MNRIKSTPGASLSISVSVCKCPYKSALKNVTEPVAEERIKFQERNANLLYTARHPKSSKRNICYWPITFI